MTDDPNVVRDKDLLPICEAACQRGQRLLVRAAPLLARAVKRLLEEGQPAREAKRWLLSDPVFEGCLTEKGRQDPELAVENTVHIACSAWYRLRDDRQFRRASYAWGRRFVAVTDGRTCEAGLALHGAHFPRGSEPSIPLPECTAEHCRCAFQMIRKAPKPEN